MNKEKSIDNSPKRVIGKTTRRTAAYTIITFFAVLLVMLLIIFQIQYSGTSGEKERMAYLAKSLGSEVYETLQAQLGKTKVLEAYLLQNDGRIEGFDATAELLLDNPNMQNVLFAPGGVVAAAYPYETNKELIGFSMNHESAGNREAQYAKRLGELYLAGPFELVEGGMGLAGRLPIFLGESKEYWGLVSVTLKYPDILENIDVNAIYDQGYSCEMWRINTDNGQKQVILSTPGGIRNESAAYFSRQSMFNSAWTISISPIKLWYQRPVFWFEIMVCVIAAFLAAIAVHLLSRMRQMKLEQTQEKIENLQRQLELEQSRMLLGQISSHFFYHTLNSLQALIILKPEAAFEMAEDFSKYLRFSIDASSLNGGIGSFRDELRAVRAYSHINEQQLGGRLKVFIDVQKNTNFSMPVLTIQPIVENSILHGIKPKVGGGTVRISYAETDDCHVVTVEDDGMGYEVDTNTPGSDVDKTEGRHNSVGLQNVRRRLNMYEGCGIEIESKVGVGTKVVLRYSKTIEL